MFYPLNRIQSIHWNEWQKSAWKIFCFTIFDRVWLNFLLNCEIQKKFGCTRFEISFQLIRFESHHVLEQEDKGEKEIKYDFIKKWRWLAQNFGLVWEIISPRWTKTTVADEKERETSGHCLGTRWTTTTKKIVNMLKESKKKTHTHTHTTFVWKKIRWRRRSSPVNVETANYLEHPSFKREKR